MKGKNIFPFLLAALSTALLGTVAAASTVDPPDKTVRVFCVVPNDIALDSAYPKGMGKVMLSSQKYFLAQCKYTFKLNNPVCEVIKGTHPSSWYNTPDEYSRIIFQGTDDLCSQIPALKTDANSGYKRWKQVVYVIAESPNDGGGGRPGWLGLPKHDADGAKIYPRDTARWCGGMCHELGHLWGLGDASSTDGTVMSASFYGWPNCIFNSGHISSMKNSAANSGFWFDNIVGTMESFYLDMTAPEQWSPLVRGNQLQVGFTMAQPFLATVGLYDLAGKRAAAFVPANAHQGNNLFTFDLVSLSTGKYICALEKNGAPVQRSIITKTR